MDIPFLCAVAANVDPKARTVEVTLDDGNVYRCSLADVSDRLRLVDASLLTDWEWIGPRAGMHWPAVDEDLSIEYLVANGVLCKQSAGASLESVQAA
jgi:hypothetical protein